jgi:hypothetical protein
MRLISKIFSIILVLYILSILFASSIKAQCACKSQCGPNEELDDLCTDPYKPYYCCRPTSTPASQPTPTKGSGASPTDTPVPNPTIGGAVCPNPTYPNCSGTDYCNVINCGKTIAGCPNPPIPTIPNCSSTCLNGHCYTTNPGTNPTITNVPCTTWGSWGSCLSGSSTCGGCASTGYTCQTRFCANPPNSNQYQISCGCSQPPGGGGGGGGSNTTSLSLQLLDPNLNVITPPVRLYCPPTPPPSPYRSPTPTPTIRCYGHITPGPTNIIVTTCPTYPPPTYGPQPPGNYACFYQHTSLCKVRCDTTPCISVACEQDVSYANFQGVPENRGGGIFDPYNLLTVIGITPIQNQNLKEGNNLPDCQNNSQLKNCYTWSQALSSGYRLINYIVVTSTPAPTATPIPTATPTPNPHWIKLKNASFSSPRPLTQPIPASPVAFDADDDGSLYFIIASCF